MKRLLILSIAVALVFSGATLAQQKRTSTAKKKTTPTAKPATPDLRAEANLVAEQLKLLTRFVYVYGKTANGLEMAELQAKQEATPDVQAKLQAKNAQTRSALVASIGSLKDGVDRVGQRFPTIYLQIQYLKVLSASEAIVPHSSWLGRKFDEVVAPGSRSRKTGRRNRRNPITCRTGSDGSCVRGGRKENGSS